MSIVSARMSEVSLGEAQKHLGLTMIPMLAEGPEQPQYRLLDDALSAGCARATEVSDAGSVPELKFINDCDQPVLLLDGEELVGAKQNRILNLTVLAPARTSIVIPVSCVEAGRWHRQSADFTSARRAHFSRGRAKKAARVTESLRDHGMRRGDQAEVWNDILYMSKSMGAFSNTGAAAAIYEKHRSSLDDYLQAFQPVSGQSGAIFAINGMVSGLDLFDSPATLATLLPKLVESFALDAIDSMTGEEEHKDIVSTELDNFIEQTAKVKTAEFPAVGEGVDLRLQDDKLSGGALVYDERIIHLCVFRIPRGDENEGTSVGTQRPMVRASQRRRGRSGA